MQSYPIKTQLKVGFKRAAESTFLRNASSLMLYTIAGQLITVLLSLVLTRIYAPREFGLLGLLISFPTLVGNAICLNFNTAAPAPTRDEDGAAIVIGALIIAVIMSFAVTLVHLFFVLTNLIGFGVLPVSSSVLVWAMLITSGLASPLQYWCIREQNFKQLGQGVIIQNGARAVVQLTFGLFSATWAGLATGEIVGRVGQLLRYYAAASKSLWRFAAVTNFQIIRSALLRYRKFATVLLPPMFLETLWDSVPIPALNFLFGLTPAGQYFLMRRVFDLPVAFISRTIGDAFYGKISEYARTDPSRIRRMLVVVFVALSSITAVCLLPLLALGPSIFDLVFGHSWRQAGLWAAIMVPPMVLQVGTAPVVRVFAVTNRPYLRYPFTLVELVGGGGLFLLAWYLHFTMVTTVIGLSAVYSLAYLTYIATAYIAAGHIETDVLAPSTGA